MLMENKICDFRAILHFWRYVVFKEYSFRACRIPHIFSPWNYFQRDLARSSH